MVLGTYLAKRALLAALSMALLSSCIHKKYETPITKNTQQPDKVLFDQAMHDIEHGRYEVARISLQTLMNTYESSEYMAKAKLAVADSWFREGGANGLAQAEAEYKDFILFYPSMEEAAEAQNRVCEIHYKQMDKSDRDWTQTLRAEDECRQLLVQFPNSKFAPQAAQRLRNIQESLAGHEFVVGDFYYRRDMNPAAANRLNALVDQYPLYSKAGDALYEAGVSYSKMGPRFRKKAGEMFARVVSEYPLSDRADAAKKRLEEMEMPVPQVDRAAYDREKYEKENYHRPRADGPLHGISERRSGREPCGKIGNSDDDGSEADNSRERACGCEHRDSDSAGRRDGHTDVSATPLTGSSALDKKTDARGSGTTAQAQRRSACSTPAHKPRQRTEAIAREAGEEAGQAR